MEDKGRQPEKKLIFYTRDYRRFSSDLKGILIYLLLCVLPVTVAFLLGYSRLTYAVSTWAATIVSSVSGQAATLLSGEFFPIFGEVYFIGAQGTLPTFTHTLICLVVCLVGIIVITQLKHNLRPLMIYLSMGLFVQVVSCVFFLFWPDKFPYTLTTYSELYMKQQVTLWLIIPLIFGVAASLVNTGGASRYIAYFTVVAITLVYGTARYVVNLCLLYLCTSLYMAPLFFMFGTLFDFIQMVAIYAVFVKRASEMCDTPKGRLRWMWL